MPKTLCRNTHALRSRNWYKQMIVNSSGLTQGLSIPNLKGIGLEPKF
jgi:hypothetical protein